MAVIHGNTGIRSSNPRRVSAERKPVNFPIGVQLLYLLQLQASNLANINSASYMAFISSFPFDRLCRPDQAQNSSNKSRESVLSLGVNPLRPLLFTQRELSTRLYQGKISQNRLSEITRVSKSWRTISCLSCQEWHHPVFTFSPWENRRTVIPSRENAISAFSSASYLPSWSSGVASWPHPLSVG